MPQLFFTWVNKERQKIHFEFLDNSVAYGERPKTVAFGWNGQLTVLDMDCMRRLGRYRKINVEAQRPEDVFLTHDGDEDDILADCIDKIPDVTFADPKTLKVLGRTHAGKRVYEVKGFFAKAGLGDVAGGREFEPSPASPRNWMSRTRNSSR